MRPSDMSPTSAVTPAAFIDTNAPPAPVHAFANAVHGRIVSPSSIFLRSDTSIPDLLPLCGGEDRDPLTPTRYYVTTMYGLFIVAHMTRMVSRSGGRSAGFIVIQATISADAYVESTRS